TLDVEGNVLAVIDPRSNTLVQQGFDLLGRGLHHQSADTGERWVLPDVGGKPLYQWDDRNQRVRHAYDELHRPVEEWLSVGGGPETLLISKRWGEHAPDAQLHNLRGQLWKTYDSAGLFESADYDFKGNRLESRRRFTTTYDATIAWPVEDP